MRMNALHDADPIPTNSWYAVAAAHEVGREPVARRLLGQGLVLYRTASGAAVALADRCAHRPVPLSTGRVEGDDIIAAYTGFRYAPDGRCVAVPTQSAVPFEARVAAYPVHEDGSFIWVWAGAAALAALRPTPDTALLRDPDWHTIGGEWETAAGLRLMHDNFADITHVALVDPEIAPPALFTTPPPLQVRVSETTVSFSRTFPPAPVARWHADLLEAAPEATYEQVEEGEFRSPGLWVDRWTVRRPEGDACFVFTHALAPVDNRRTRHAWRVSRNFARSAGADGALAPIFERYYSRVRSALETMQSVLDEEGGQDPRSVRLTADAAGIAVARIMARMVEAEQEA
ncbi:MAG: Rieske 2Fe-2S domain-containing protein [Nocardioides sp.]